MRLIVRVMVGPVSGWRRAISFLFSVALHVGLLTLLSAVSSAPRGPLTPTDSHHTADKKYRIIWFYKAERFPLVDSSALAEVRLPDAPTKTKQVVFTTPKRVAAPKQFILSAAPKIALQPEVPSPNLISLVVPAPRVVAPPPRSEVKRFVPPESKTPSSPTPPEIPPPEFRESSKGELPLLQAIDSLATPRLTHPPARRFIPPDEGVSRPGAQAALVTEGPPPLASSSNGIGVGTDSQTLVILSATPANSARVPVPVGDRPDAIQIGGIPGGQASGGTGGAGVVIPGLNVRGESGKTGVAVASVSTNPLPSVAPPNLVPTRPRPLPPPVNTPTVSVPQWPHARRVPTLVDSAFQDRPVYATVLTPPNGLPDWVVWFSETVTVAPGVRVFMRPPVPRQMVWPDAPNALSEGSGVTWVQARLTKEGMMVAVSVRQSGSSSAATLIAQVLGQWLFSPASRNGQPIDADVLLEMPLLGTRVR
jgi:hypothetical protein